MLPKKTVTAGFTYCCGITFHTKLGPDYDERYTRPPMSSAMFLHPAPLGDKEAITYAREKGFKSLFKTSSHLIMYRLHDNNVEDLYKGTRDARNARRRELYAEHKLRNDAIKAKELAAQGGIR